MLPFKTLEHAIHLN